MLGTKSLKRFAAAALTGGALVLSPVMMPAASAAPNCPTYASTISTTTTLSVNPGNPSSGQSFTATATVTNDATGGPVSGGTVAFKYKNQRATVDVVGGSASTTFTAGPGAGRISASYSGVCVNGVAAVDSSSDAFVLGVESNNGNNGNNRPGSSVSGGSNVRGGGLANTGLDNATELFAGLGLGLLALGGASLIIHRRRVQA